MLKSPAYQGWVNCPVRRRAAWVASALLTQRSSCRWFARRAFGHAHAEPGCGLVTGYGVGYGRYVGQRGSRAVDVTARTQIVALDMPGRCRLSKNTCTWPPIRSVRAGPAPCRAREPCCSRSSVGTARQRDASRCCCQMMPCSPCQVGFAVVARNSATVFIGSGCQDHHVRRAHEAGNGAMSRTKLNESFCRARR